MRRTTSRDSTKDCTQTCPSIDDDAMWIAFEGVGATGPCFGVLGDPCCGGLSPFTELAGEFWRSDAILLTASTLDDGSGGGKGDIEIEEVDAE